MWEQCLYHLPVGAVPRPLDFRWTRECEASIRGQGSGSCKLGYLQIL